MTDTRSMRQSLILVLLICAAALWGQDAAATEAYLVNRTTGTLYVLDQRATELSPSARFRQVPPDGLLPVAVDRSITGVSYERGSFSLSVFNLDARRVRELADRVATRVYIPIEERHLAADPTLTPANFAALLALPRIDNQYLDWIAREAQVARGQNRPPLGTFADFGEGRESLPLAQALLWGRGGTDLQWIKGVATESDYYFGSSSYSGFGSRTSIFLYLYGETSEVPIATLELPASHSPGFVFLWIPTRLDPVVAGNLVVSEFFLEAQIWRDTLERYAGSDLRTARVEISTANSAAGVWEEFVLSRIPMEQLFAR